MVRALRDQVDGVVIVDNGSGNRHDIEARLRDYADVDFVGLDENRGIGAALNVGADVALREGPEWILTLDQDTLVHEGAVAGILHDWSGLDQRVRERCGIVALRPHPQPGSIWLTRYVEGLQVIGDRGAFVERRGVITSGNLVRADLVRRLPFNEAMFIDQVDFEFCSSLRRLGYIVLQQKKISMDHVLGERFDDVERVHPYENAQRLYYIVRNSTYMVLRRRLIVRIYVAQVVVFCGAYVSVNGVGSVPHCLAVALRGFVDGLFNRLGRREYPFLQRGRR